MRRAWDTTRVHQYAPRGLSMLHRQLYTGLGTGGIPHIHVHTHALPLTRTWHVAFMELGVPASGFCGFVT
jgi:hypothetical protein